MKHHVMVHPKKYCKKPNDKEASIIQNQICAKENYQLLTINEIAQAYLSGNTIKDGYFKDAHKQSYINLSNSLLKLDIDNKMVDKQKKVYYTHYTIEDTIQLCKTYHLPIALIYTTFNHTPERPQFRVIFQLDKTITMAEWELFLSLLKDLIPYADKKVGPGHFTYGGREIVLLDDKAFLTTKRLYTLAKIKDKKQAQSLENTRVKSKFEKDPQSINVLKTNKIGAPKVNSDINVVKSSLRAYFESDFFATKTKALSQKTFYTVWMAIQSIRTLPLDDLLALDTKTHCFFHEDHKPSAGIAKNDGDNTWYYHCFACGVTYGIVDFVALAYDLDKTHECSLVFEKLLELFHITLVSDPYKQSWSHIFFDNEVFFSRAEKYKILFPLTSTAMIFTDSLYTIMLREAKIALEYSQEHNDQAFPLTSISRRFLMQRTGLNRAKYEARHQRLLHMGFIRVLTDNEVKAASRTLYRASKVNGEKQFTISTYAIYPITLDLLQKSEERLRQFKLSGATMKGATARQSLAIYKGKDNTFVKSKGDTPQVVHDRKILMTWARKTLNTKKYFTKESYLRYARKKGFGERYASSFIAEIVRYFALEKATGSKALIEKYHLPDNLVRKTLFIKLD